MTDKPPSNTGSPTSPGKPPARKRARRSQGFLGVVLGDVRHFSAGRTLAVARLAVKEALRLKVLGVVLLGFAAIVLADLTTRRFDPVFDTAPSMIRIAELVIMIVGLVLAVFLSTFSLPREMASRTIYSLVTKPVSRLEIVLGKAAGVVVVLAIVTFGLGVLSWGYFQWRGRQVQQLAAARCQQMQKASESASLPTDAPPAGLEAIADHGPFRAARYVMPSDPLAIVTFPPQTPARPLKARERRGLEWLTGAPDHTAHWGFENLPLDEIDFGKARIVLSVVPPATQRDGQTPEDMLPEGHRDVLVRLHFEGLYVRPDWSVALTLGADGRLEVPIPARGAPDAPGYGGGRFWVSMCGAETPRLGVGDTSCTILLSGGDAVRSASGLILTTTSSPGRYWIAGPLLAGRYRFRDILPHRIGPDGSVLQVRVGVPGASSIPPEARARVMVVDETSGARRDVTFRPEKRGPAVIPLSRDDFGGGTLAVYVKSDHPALEVSVADESVQLELAPVGDAARAFATNWLKDLTMMWLAACVLAGIGVLASTWAGWQVAALLTAVLFIVANAWTAIISNVERYGVSLSGRTVRGAAGQQVAVFMYRVVFGLLGILLPNFDRMDYGDVVARGVSAPVGGLLAVPEGALWYALVYVGATVVLGYLSFSAREVAR